MTCIFAINTTEHVTGSSAARNNVTSYRMTYIGSETQPTTSLLPVGLHTGQGDRCDSVQCGDARRRDDRGGVVVIDGGRRDPRGGTVLFDGSSLIGIDSANVRPSTCPMYCRQYRTVSKGQSKCPMF